jgi:DNA-binding HxlR family transcriptional regulator
VLTDRLRAMETRSVIARTTLPTTPARVEYSLTCLGREFEPVLVAMAKVAERLRNKYGVR